MNQAKISFQLYSARKSSDSLEAIIAGLAEIGYDAVEPWPENYLSDPKQFRALIDSHGLECLGFHLPFRDFVADPLRFCEIARTLGDAPLMIVPTVMPVDRPTEAAGWLDVGEKLGRGLEVAKKAGLRLAWHNHDYEFKRLPTGERPLDLILEGGGGELGLEIDLAWVTRAWADPVVEFERYASRIVAIQVKDTAPPGTNTEEGWTAPGEGIIDWDRLWSLIPAAPADHFVVEHDAPEDWYSLAKRSYDFLTARGAGRQAEMTE